LKNGKGEIIDYKYIILLHELQQTTGLRAGNTLTQKHVNFKKQIMKINLVAQTLSRSVADALGFCMNDVKLLPEFQGTGGTIEFIKQIDRLFDIGNS
jgi:predicted RNA-binding protein (virulence factor B family)